MDEGPQKRVIQASSRLMGSQSERRVAFKSTLNGTGIVVNLPKVKRAVILIGVQQAKNLPQLQAVWEGVARMEEWAISQGIDRDLIVKITDEDDEVFPRRIKKRIKKLVDRNDLEQIIVYFSGHGVIKGFNEYWMLTDGLEDSNASVNVTLSVELARRSSIPHVVFISDACRTAVGTVQTQRIVGSEIFPIAQAGGGEEKSVDQFYATVLGAPALEIEESDSGRYQAVYTSALLEVLRGQHAAVLEEENGVGLIRPRPLKKFLSKYLPTRVFQALGAGGASQKPDARITSEPEVWLSAVNVPLASSEATRSFGLPEDEVAGEVALEMASFPADATSRALAEEHVDLGTLLGAGQVLTRGIQPDLVAFSNMNKRFSDEIVRSAEQFGPSRLDSESGFKIRGARVQSCLATNGIVEILDDGQLDEGQLVQSEVPPRSAASVLLTLTSGIGVLIPAIGEFLATLTFDDDSLIDVAYEPSQGSSRWSMYDSRAAELRKLRAVVASSSRLGTFQLEGPDAENLARRMQVSKGIDPSLALYAAHAYRDQGKRHRIEQMGYYMERDLNFIPFDIALMAGRVKSGSHDNIVPCLPMLSQTWALLPAYEVEFPEGLADISRHVMPYSLWTVFDAEGVDMISWAIEKGEIK